MVLVVVNAGAMLSGRVGFCQSKWVQLALDVLFGVGVS